MECLCRIAYSKGIEKFYYNKDEEKDTELLSLIPWIMTVFFLHYNLFVSFISYSHMCVCVCVYSRHPQRPENGIISAGTSIRMAVRL